jgi:hypothetical protein
MARNHSLDLRKAVVARLKADAGLIALVPAERVFGEQPSALPAWPFVRYGEDSVRAFSADLPIHSFSKGPVRHWRRHQGVFHLGPLKSDARWRRGVGLALGGAVHRDAARLLLTNLHRAPLRQ